MKKLTNILLAIVAISSLASIVSSCDIAELKSGSESHQVGEPDVEGCYGVFFPVQETTGDHTFDPTMPTTVEFTVARTSSDDAITVPVEIKDEKNVFEVSPIVFADGQKETTFTVSFPNAGIAVKYPLSITITDPQYASRYATGATSVDFSVFRVEWKYFLNPTTNEPAVFSFIEDWYAHEGTCKVKYYEVDGIRTCVTETDPFTDEDGTYYGFFLSGEAQGDNELSFTWYTQQDDKNKNNFVEIPEQDVAFNSNYGAMVKLYDWYSYFTIVNPQSALAGLSWLDFAKKYNSNYDLSYYDGNGGFYIHPAYYYMIGIGGWSVNEDSIVLLADGFIRTDYSIKAETDYSYQGSIPVHFEVGKDVTEIKYVAVEGNLSATQADKVKVSIIDGTQENIRSITSFTEGETVNYADIELSFDKSGLYTVVAVAYDKEGKDKTSTFVALNYFTAEDEKDHAVKLSIGAEAVPARYGADEYSTMAYWIAGKDLTDVHYHILPYSDVSENVLYAIKADPKGNYAVSKEVLETINAEGGLYTYTTGLKANTEYALVVWATNGELDKFYYATYKTPKLPYVWNSLGKGAYTDDTITYIYEIPATTVDCDVYQENANPNLIMFKGHALALAAKLFDVTEEQMLSYEGKYWRDCEIILDITDPKSVIWEPQDLGVCLNSKDGFLDALTNLNPNTGEPHSVGIYKEGVISYPTPNGMLCTLGGKGWYYANGTGSTKLVLPSAVTPTNESVTLSKKYKFDFNPRLYTPVKKLAIERDPKSVKTSVKTIPHKSGRKTSISTREFNKAVKTSL